VHGTDRERARADAVDLVPDPDRRAARDAIADRVQDHGHVLDGETGHDQLRAQVAEPDADRVRPGRRELVAQDGGDGPADGADVVGDRLHAGFRAEVDALGQRLTFRAPAPLLSGVGAASAWWVHARHITMGV
jgi:hypothetical protein